MDDQHKKRGRKKKFSIDTVKTVKKDTDIDDGVVINDDDNSDRNGDRNGSKTISFGAFNITVPNVLLQKEDELQRIPPSAIVAESATIGETHRVANYVRSEENATIPIATIPITHRVTDASSPCVRTIGETHRLTSANYVRTERIKIIDDPVMSSIIDYNELDVVRVRLTLDYLRANH